MTTVGGVQATSKVTSKLQVTIPKVIADRYGIRPGDEIVWEPAGGAVRVRPAKAPALRLGPEERARLWRDLVNRQREREAALPPALKRPSKRDWTREDLYDDRGRPR
jgi:AbrB family looped-hinge helix DNA binding protein